MKKLFLILAVLALFISPVMAQWGGGQIKQGATVTHRSSQAYADTWFSSNNKSVTSTSLALNRFNHVRADFDITGSDVSIDVTWQCSNDSLWLNEDTINVQEDSWITKELSGCAAYNYHVDSVSSGDTITIYLTPYNE